MFIFPIFVFFSEVQWGLHRIVGVSPACRPVCCDHPIFLESHHHISIGKCHWTRGTEAAAGHARNFATWRWNLWMAWRQTYPKEDGKMFTTQQTYQLLMGISWDFCIYLQSTMGDVAWCLETLENYIIIDASSLIYYYCKLQILIIWWSFPEYIWIYAVYRIHIYKCTNIIYQHSLTVHTLSLSCWVNSGHQTPLNSQPRGPFQDFGLVFAVFPIKCARSSFSLFLSLNSRIFPCLLVKHWQCVSLKCSLCWWLLQLYVASTSPCWLNPHTLW